MHDNPEIDNSTPSKHEQIKLRLQNSNNAHASQIFLKLLQLRIAADYNCDFIDIEAVNLTRISSNVWKVINQKNIKI